MLELPESGPVRAGGMPPGPVLVSRPRGGGCARFRFVRASAQAHFDCAGSSIRPSGLVLRRLIHGLMALVLTIQPVVAAGLSILSAADSERTPSGLADEIPEERLEESEEDRDAESDDGAVCPPRPIGRAALEAVGACGATGHGPFRPSVRRADPIRGPPFLS